jgi:DNA-binding transcriptional MerR regulator
VLGILKPEFPDITVSKIRFLEGAGLVQPDRSASGYRKFSEDDVARLRFVLRAQRDQYLPLRVIRQRLADLEQVGDLDARGGLPLDPTSRPDQGAPPGAPAAAGQRAGAGSPGSGAAGAGTDVARAADGDGAGAGGAGAAVTDAPAGGQAGRATGAGFAAAPPSDAQFTRDELCRAAGATVEQLLELESFGLVSARGSGERGAWYGGDDLVRQRNPEARTRARDTIEALAQLGGRMRDLALRSAVHGLADTRDPHR